MSEPKKKLNVVAMVTLYGKTNGPAAALVAFPEDESAIEIGWADPDRMVCRSMTEALYQSRLVLRDRGIHGDIQVYREEATGKNLKQPMIAFSTVDDHRTISNLEWIPNGNPC